jgi:hypothetical protein
MIMTRRKEGVPDALEASGAVADEEGRRKVADAVATLLESRYCPQELSDFVADHVIRISEATELYIFAPEVVRAVYPLMCERAEQMEAERRKEERREKRGRRKPRAAKSKGVATTAETDSVN